MDRGADLQDSRQRPLQQLPEPALLAVAHLWEAPACDGGRS